MAAFSASLIALATTGHAETMRYTDAEMLAMCEPSEFVIDEALLEPADWAEVDQTAATLPNSTGRLWRIETAEGKVSHLWGTMHATDTRLSNVPDPLELLIADARTLMLEFVGADLSMSEMRDMRDWADFYAEGASETLRQLPPAAEEAINARLRSLGIHPGDIALINPVKVLEFLLFSPCDDRLTSAGYPIQDMRIELLGADAGAALKALDAPDILDDLGTQKRWKTAFRDTLTAYALYLEMPEATATLATLYLRGEIGRMAAFEEVYLQRKHPEIDVAKTFASMSRFLLAYRNKEMLHRALPELEKGDAVMAVGAYHIYGETGLVALMREAGLKVERIHLPGEVE